MREHAYMHSSNIPPSFSTLCLVITQRWFPLYPIARDAENPLLGTEGRGDSVGDVGRWAAATEQRSDADFAHYNPIIQVAFGFIGFKL